MIGNPSGLGNALVRASQALQPEQMFAYVFVIGVLGVGLSAAFQFVPQVSVGLQVEFADRDAAAHGPRGVGEGDRRAGTRIISVVPGDPARRW